MNSEKKYYTIQEVHEQIELMTEEEHEAIIIVANSWYFRYRLSVKSCSQNPIDFSQEVLKKALLGIRRIPVGLPLTAALCMHIKSEIYHASKKLKPIDFDVGDCPGMFPEIPSLLNKQDLDDLKSRLLDATRHIDKGELFLELLFDNPELKPQDIALILCVSPEKIYRVRKNIRKNLKR